uniref:Membrane protein n=1 Tax=uncultured bacterium F39-01 TaxID=1191434 RepID=I3VID7_9BACT|nr:membrane protein [uncultured bacterium F39-01]
MSHLALVESIPLEKRAARLQPASLLSKGIFGALVLLIFAAAVPYGTAEPWWKAMFICATFAICIAAIIETSITGWDGPRGFSVLLPMLSLSVFAFLQTISIGGGNPDPAVSSLAVWNAVSADPYQTRFFSMEMLALTACLALFYRYANSATRIQVLIYSIIGVAAASAIYGILRQTTQQDQGFLLPLMKQQQGYGQFINKNHFAYLMEMALGLGLGICIAGGVKRERVMIYVALLLPVWTGLVLSNSRGGVLAMLTQFGVGALILLNSQERFGLVSHQGSLHKVAQSKILRIVFLVALITGILFGTLWVGGDQLVTNFQAATGELNPTAVDGRTGSSRNEIWRATLKMFAAHPILGVGMGAYWIAITAYHDASGQVTPQEAHNDYLELLSSGGLVGFAIGVWFALIVYKRVRRNLRNRDPFERAVCVGSVLGIAGVAVHSLVDFGLHMLANALVFIAVIMLATGEFGAKAEIEH